MRPDFIFANFFSEDPPMGLEPADKRLLKPVVKVWAIMNHQEIRKSKSKVPMALQVFFHQRLLPLLLVYRHRCRSSNGKLFPILVELFYELLRDVLPIGNNIFVTNLCDFRVFSFSNGYGFSC